MFSAVPAIFWWGCDSSHGATGFCSCDDHCDDHAVDSDFDLNRGGAVGDWRCGGRADEIDLDSCFGCVIDVSGASDPNAGGVWTGYHATHDENAIPAIPDPGAIWPWMT